MRLKIFLWLGLIGEESYQYFSTDNGDLFPEHLMTEILSRLPVRSLLQFKSVCKLWYSIIKSSHFISKHLKNYYDNADNWRDCLIVQYAVTQAGEINVYECSVDDMSKEILSFQRICTPIFNTFLCGPCNGSSSYGGIILSLIVCGILHLTTSSYYHI